MAREREELKDLGKPTPEDRKLSALDRAIQQAVGDGKKVGREDDPARALFPQVWEWLTKTEGGKDYVMQPAVITLQLGPEGCLVTITHRDLRRTMAIGCPFLQDALKALEDTFSGPNPPIRTWGKDEPNLRKRRQK